MDLETNAADRDAVDVHVQYRLDGVGGEVGRCLYLEQLALDPALPTQLSPGLCDGEISAEQQEVDHRAARDRAGERFESSTARGRVGGRCLQFNLAVVIEEVKIGLYLELAARRHTRCEHAAVDRVGRRRAILPIRRREPDGREQLRDRPGWCLSRGAGTREQ